jgi:hypothetical protein
MRRWTLVAVLLAAACGGNKPPPDHPPSFDLPESDAAMPVATADAAAEETPPIATGPSTFVVPGEAITVTLVAKGKKGKAQPLRYQLAAGTAQVLDHTLDVSLEYTVPTQNQTQSQKAPTQNFGRTSEVVSVDSGTSAAVIKATLDRGSAADAAMTEGLEQLKGSTIEATFDAQGRPGDATVVSRAPDLESAKTIAGLLENRTRSVVLPTEPIAIGGSWKVVRKERVNDIESEVTTTYKLTARKGDLLTVTGVLSSTTAPQTLTSPQGPIDVKSMTGGGTLTATIDLHRPAPAIKYDEAYDAIMVLNGMDVRVVSKIASTQVVRDR